ncbi:putative RNA-dependent RNA polymerase 1 [Cladobotryum mycophilum]|uniref:RNA-dependent RNA polymerase 1 n=1 Tax=Cladobotryum mycophilum TaxID=491253 RepID=A0ABR0SCS6_9HYPO
MPRTTKPQSFEHVLCKRISLDDMAWDFAVPGLPTSGSANKASLVKMISLSTKDSSHKLVLRYIPAETNRATREGSLDLYLLISFADFRSLRNSFNAKESESNPVQPTTARECSDYVTKLLRTGIVIQGVHYNFFGHSNSQLKSRTCFLYAASKEAIANKIEALGDFTKMKTVAKKAKRIGLLFSTAKVAMEVDPKRIEDITDIETGDYIFTDGCGLIELSFAQDLARRIGIVFRNVRYTPSVFQIRYRGYKGVITLDPTMKRAESWLKLRKSMKKFSGGGDHSFSVVEYSKPYTFGYLNDEIILLLDTLGIDRQMLLHKQQEHFDFLQQATQDPRAAFRFLCYINRPDLAERVIMSSLDSVQPVIQQLVNAEYDKMLNKRDEQKCRILIRKSRLLFGVCDAWGVLKEGECAVKVTMDGDGQAYALKGMKVLVTRNPCLHPGDVRKLDVVERTELAHLVDCIVFPTSGRRPAADLMSGGDLDGDTFFVTWDPDIIPSTMSQAAQYPGVPEPIRFKPISDDDRLVYFARYTNASLGRVKNLYLNWSRAKGSMSPECQELNRLFSQCVDGNRIKDSQLSKFEKPPIPDPEAPPFILDLLHEEAKSIVAKQRKPRNIGIEGYTIDGLELLLCRDAVALSEIELVKMAVRWCRKTGTMLDHLMHAIDFNALTAEEKSWVLAQLPSSIDFPSLVLNALHSSELVTRSELEYFHLDYPGLHWKRVYTSSQDRLATFLDAASKNLELFQRKLILFRPHERLTLAIYVPQKITAADDCVVDNRVRLFAFSHSQGSETQSRLSLPTKMGYRLFCDENFLQLFEGKRSNTWIFIGRAASNDSSYRNLPRVQDRRKARVTSLASGVNFDFRASIALDKFSKGLQTHIGKVQREGISAAEIYIITNRDTKSMKNLDLWEKYIDTEKKLPLFEHSPKDYDVPNLKNIDWGSQNGLVVEIAKHGNFSALQDVLDPRTLRIAFMWFLEREQKALLFRCFQFLVTAIRDNNVMEPAGTLRVMTDFADLIPHITITFANLGSWKKLPDGLETIMQNCSSLLLRNIVLSESEYGDLILAPFKDILDNVKWLSFTGFSDLIETIALVVHSHENALDLLLGCLDQQRDRIFTGRPAIIHLLVRNMIGIAMEHIAQAQEESEIRNELLNIQVVDQNPNSLGTQVEVLFRIDATGGTPMTNTHVRLTTASPPQSSPLGSSYSMDGLVTESRPGVAKILCLHPLPSYYRDSSWTLETCGLFVTTKTMLDAIRNLAILEGECCGIIDQILGIRTVIPATLNTTDFSPDPTLNKSQNDAVEASERHNLTCLWGPPGTGKTQTIVAIIRRLQLDPTRRILVTAPTHNAVDNVMRRYLRRLSQEGCLQIPNLAPLRVSTEIRKVGEDLRRYTCDGLAGEEIYSSHNAMRQAKNRVAKARIIFTTCIGAGVGFLREETFDTVIVDEASQQTEPVSLVPLAKGCLKAILVGDHVQLRPTVQNITLALNFDISLFERLYTCQVTPGMAKVMLDTQYRMHPSICEMVSREFYSNMLLSGLQDDDRPMPASAFPWPVSLRVNPVAGGNVNSERFVRMVFIECSEREELGGKSKANKTQADLCLSICKLLRAASAATHQYGETPSLAVLTPYTRQAQLLKGLLAGIEKVEVSSIDGFQGREADVVIFVTVRCNESREIGFLKDSRRMNVALTRARLGLIVIGNRATLTGGSEEEASTGMWKRLLAQMQSVDIEAM